MKKAATAEEDNDIRPEYDLASLPGGVRGKYAHRFSEGTHLVRLDPDVATVFPDEKSVNDALRLLMELAKRLLAPST